MGRGRSLRLLIDSAELHTFIGATSLQGISARPLDSLLCLLISVDRPEYNYGIGKISFVLIAETEEVTALERKHSWNSLHNFVLPRFVDRELDPVSCTLAYVEKVQPLLNVNNNLFITYVKLHKPGSRLNYCRVEKKQLREAGVDIVKFSAHSTCKAMASKGASAGVDEDDHNIRLMGKGINFCFVLSEG